MLLTINIFNQDCQKSVIEMNVTDDFLVGAIIFDDPSQENLLLFRAIADGNIVIWGLIGVNQQFSIGAIKWMNLKPNLIVNSNKAKKLGIKSHSFKYQDEVKNTFLAQHKWLTEHHLDSFCPKDYEYIIPPALMHQLMINVTTTKWYDDALINISNFYDEVYS